MDVAPIASCAGLVRSGCADSGSTATVGWKAASKCAFVWSDIDTFHATRRTDVALSTQMMMPPWTWAGR